MDLKTLECFVAVAETGSISAAARKLNLSQPPLSLRIRALEEELDVTLMERGSRQVILTDGGRLLYARAKSILEFTAMTKKEVEDLRLGRGGSLRLGVASSCGPLLLSGPIPCFRQRFPGVQFQLFERNTYELIELLKSDAVDLAIVRTPFEAPLESRVLPLQSEALCAIFTRRYFQRQLRRLSPAFRGQKPLSLADLNGLPLIVYRRWLPVLAAVQPPNKKDAACLCICDDARTCVNWARSELGIALVPESICPREAAKEEPSDLLRLPLCDGGLESDICALWRETGYLPAAARHFIDLLQAAFPPAP